MTLAALAAGLAAALATAPAPLADVPLALGEAAGWPGGAATKVWAVTAALVLVAGATLARARRGGWPALGPVTPGPLRVVASRALSGKQRVALLEVDGAGHSERLVVAFSQEGAQLLARLPASPPEAASLGAEPPARRRRRRQQESLEVAL